MITYLNGKVTDIEETSIIIETYGVGYEVFCVSHQFYDEMAADVFVKVYIYEHIREDAHDLYGFKSKEERELFKRLTSVNGIGPKGGMQVLNTYTSHEIVSIILSGDSKALTKVSGIGTKTAQRIILELKDSLSKLNPDGLGEKTSGYETASESKNEAIEALVTLGYTESEASKAVQVIFDERDSSEGLIRKALSLLSE